MELQKPVRSSLAKQVSSQLESLIESGQWPVGTKIPAEPELVEQLGVSRNTIREAVQALIHAGMLEARQGDGTYVRASNHFEASVLRRLRGSSIADTLEARYCLERECARLAAIRRTPADLERIRACLDKRNEKTEHLDAFVRADVEFHMSIASAAHNDLLYELYLYMNEHLRYAISSTLGNLELLNELTTLHNELYNTIRARDPVAAEKVASDMINLLSSRS
ncbi:FadR/GntR family transcriptional regulator [Paenibacillus sp. MSJ-34]|uniref:FadR/GntR family transcriptional regulator n=1 Tax=Paenibacillus sp. MSJ-34 TaxID=2841529 RepID=UPI001C0F799D|nr:FadR/GntR family transcriptional regulator [Paenibacillus sp. MSJ-34]MBU5443229.1 FadR family transcriptional regulator [Paenibacillus sp. MSJ-34]